MSVAARQGARNTRKGQLASEWELCRDEAADIEG